jgi:glutathione synthase/RimK-type ligase-like ATP-grasp enzyme
MTPPVLLATFCLCPDGEPGGAAIIDALADRGIDAAWAAWDDASVDWAAAGLVAVRATWDYHRRLAPFLAWARRVEATSTLLNGVDTFVWNHDKGYLLELGATVPVVPAEPAPDDDLFGGLSRALARWGTVVVKPRIGASGVGLVVADRTDDPRLAGLTAGPWLIRPVVESVRTRGETSVMVLAGRPVTQVDKLPVSGEVRVHEQYGGSSVAVPVEDAAGALARRAVAAAEELLGHPLDYARVDLMELDGELVVSELELIEPGLYLDLAPESAGPFADLVAARLP